MSENDLTANSVYFEDVPEEQGTMLTLDETLRNNFVGLINDRFTSAEDSRDLDESRWLTAYHNYRGLYAKNIRFRESEKSRVFVKVTKTKVLAAFGQLVDVVFGANKFPIGITETKLPEGVLKYAHVDVQNPLPGLETTQEDQGPEESPYDVGFEGDGKVLKAGATFGKGKFEDTPVEVELENQGKLEEGLSPNPQVAEISPAQKAARRMEQLIHDQIEESNGASEIRNALFESALFGTGIVKGPFNFNKTLHRWTQGEDGTRSYSPIDVRVPRLEFVSIWDFFPDPNATSINECEYIFHRHKMNRTQLRGLTKMPYFDKEMIRDCLRMGPNYVEKHYEQELKDDNGTDQQGASQFDVLEYWGVMDAEYCLAVKEAGNRKHVQKSMLSKIL